MVDIKGKVAIVTGASRGAGRGIALVLGQAGAIVYVTGRSTRSGPLREGYPGTIEDTAKAITACGGVGISVKCDHRVDSDVEALVSLVAQQQQGRLDILVNNAYGGSEEAEIAARRPFWEMSLAHWEHLFPGGLRNHLVASRLAVRLMLPRRQGLIVTTSYWAADQYMVNLPYDVAMASFNRLAFAMAEDLRPHGIASVALVPGFMRTELVEARYDGDLSVTESTEYIGRAVAALAADSQVLKKSGRVLFVGDLAREYGFTDVDGRLIPPYHTRSTSA